MTPETILQNLTTLLQAMMLPGGILAAVGGTIAYAAGKATDSPFVVRWGKNGWLGAVILFGGAAVVGLIQGVSARIFGGGAP